MDIEEKLQKLEEIATRNNDMLMELTWANVFHDATAGCSWFPKEGLPCWPGRGAAGYQYMYVAYRILNELRPKSILEIGMGQSTRLIGQYIKTRDTEHDYNHYCVEHDADWAKICQEQWPLDTGRSHVVILPLGIMSFSDSKGNNRDTVIYNGFYDSFKGKTFDLISIDGPYGYNDPLYSRIDILELLPGCLGNDFCILVDDYNRSGEQRTVEAICMKLDENKIKYDSAVYRGEKKMCVIASESWSFLCCL